jgi:hypothetical protein
VIKRLVTTVCFMVVVYLAGAAVIDGRTTFHPWHPWWGLFVLAGTVLLFTFDGEARS